MPVHFPSIPIRWANLSPYWRRREEGIHLVNLPSTAL